MTQGGVRAGFAQGAASQLRMLRSLTMLVAGIVGWQRGVFHVVPGAVVVDARDEACLDGIQGYIMYCMAVQR